MMRNLKRMAGWGAMLLALGVAVGCGRGPMTPRALNVPIDSLYSSADMHAEFAAVYPDPARYENQIAEFEAADQEAMPPEGAIVAYGSSSIRGWHRTIQADLAPLTIIPRGFGGSTMFDALHFADRAVIPYRPRAILLYEGDNDIFLKIPPETVRDAYLALAARLHEALPEARVYFIAIKPSINRWNVWPQMREANALIAAECALRDWMTYIDVATPMLGEDGEPRPDIFLGDQLHLNATGYAIWREVVRQVLMDRELAYENQ